LHDIDVQKRKLNIVLFVLGKGASMKEKKDGNCTFVLRKETERRK